MSFASGSIEMGVGMHFLERSSPVPSDSIKQLRNEFERGVRNGGELYRTSLSLDFIAGGGFGLRYCFEYQFKGSTRSYDLVADAVSRYKGRFRWVLRQQFNGKGVCISSTPINQVRAGSVAQGHIISFDELFFEANQFSTYLETEMRASAPAHVAASDPVNPANLQDPDSEGLHEIYILRNVQAGIYGRLFETDRHLHFGLDLNEWKTLMITIVRMPPSATESFTGLTEPIRDFPLLSRLAGPYDSAAYQPTEVEALREECKRATQMSPDPTLKAAVGKLLLAADWAQHLHSGVLFSPRN